jgi:hypothetical protein
MKARFGSGPPILLLAEDEDNPAALDSVQVCRVCFDKHTEKEPMQKTNHQGICNPLALYLVYREHWRWHSIGLKERDWRCEEEAEGAFDGPGCHRRSGVITPRRFSK